MHMRTTLILDDALIERAVEEAMRMLKERPLDRATSEPAPPTWGKRRDSH